MATYRYLIVGSGMTAQAAAAGIREVDATGPIGIFGDDPNPPYQRPPLSKKLWTGQATEESIWLPLPSDVTLHPGRRIVSIDPSAHRATDDQGTPHGFERLLLATGGTPRRLPFGGERVVYFRTLDDYRRLRADPGRRVAVIGGGFIGSEVAAALAIDGRQVTMIFPEPAIGARVYPADLARFLDDYYRQKGVEVWSGEQVAGIEGRGGASAVRTASGREVVVDTVVAGLGIRPNVELARDAGLSASDGIAVAESLRTSAPDVFAAGDVARFWNPALGERIRVEHEDNALTMGREAGRSMAGAQVRYEHLPFFYSDLFDLGYEAVGRLDAHFETVVDWKTPHREGVVYYLDGQDRVRGVLLWGIFGQVDAARELIRRGAVKRGDVVHAIAH